MNAVKPSKQYYTLAFLDARVTNVPCEYIKLIDSFKAEVIFFVLKGKAPRTPSIASTVYFA